MDFGQGQVCQGGQSLRADARAWHDDQAACGDCEHVQKAVCALRGGVRTTRAEDPLEAERCGMFYRLWRVRAQVDGAVQCQVKALRLGHQIRQNRHIQPSVAA